tara:strand:- start:2927 stop:3319 length:393 start_codon:yes stop_codon:yes gene_type:complete
MMGRRLTEEDKENILSCWKTGRYTQKEIAKIFLTGQGTVYRICRGSRKGVDPKGVVPFPPPPIDAPLSPLDFKRHKLTEVTSDILTARAFGSVNTLVGLHKLQIALFEEVLTMEQKITKMRIVKDDQILH